MNFKAVETNEYEVVAVNRGAGLILLSTGDTAPITTWLDGFGDECFETEAVVAVAGPIHGKKTLTFFSVDLREYEKAGVH